MDIALGLARKGLGKTNPNPMVGAVIVKNGKIAGRGYHQRAGLDHAEIAAIKDAGENADGSTLYVNLEPCNHYGQTPPCADAIIRNGIKKVVASMKDPNPDVNGEGFKKLKKAGIVVKTGILEDKARKLNEIFIKYITKKMPFIIVKVAQSLDGKIATRQGDSKWISNELSRRYVHELRGQVDAVMVGAGTILKDDPLLTSRPPLEAKTQNKKNTVKQPIKVIVDYKLETPVKARIFSKESPARVIMATAEKTAGYKISRFKRLGCEVLTLSERGGKADLRQLMRELAKKGITSILVEGGGTLIGSLTDSGLIDKYLFFMAPKIIGGRDAITSVEGTGAKNIKESITLKDVKIRKFGSDLLIEGYTNCSQA